MSRWGCETMFRPSPEQCALLKLKVPRAMSASQIISHLEDAGKIERERNAGESEILAEEVHHSALAKNRWQQAYEKAKSTTKPWNAFEIHKRPTELCRRFDYDSASDSWQESISLVKMEAFSFARGAMRECYRMKKMSQVNAHLFYTMDWKDCNNYVAKR